MRLRALWLQAHGETQETVVLSVAVYLFVLAAALAATGIGGDYRAGTVGTPLTWEPRRVRLATARLLAIATVTVGIYLTVTAVLVGGWWIGASARGSTTVPTGFWGDLATIVARSAVTTVGFALLTAGVVLLTRSTVGGIVVWIGYLVGVEGVLASQISGLRERLLIVNLAAFLDGHVFRVSDGGGSGDIVRIGPSHGVVVLTVVVVVVAALGVLAFARRDVA
jgi:ABC-2 type transport system permease protein